jgi:hypothetical protein
MHSSIPFREKAGPAPEPRPQSFALWRSVRPTVSGPSTGRHIHPFAYSTRFITLNLFDARRVAKLLQHQRVLDARQTSQFSSATR